MRLSRPDENDSAKRRHFEISIDSPFNILSCRATQANISLPAYSAGLSTPPQQMNLNAVVPGPLLDDAALPLCPKTRSPPLPSPLPMGPTSSAVGPTIVEG